MFTRDGDAVNPYQYVPAWSLEDGDQITYQNDVLTDVTVMDETDTIMVKGESLVSGDRVTYFVTPDTEIGLWSA